MNSYLLIIQFSQSPTAYTGLVEVMNTLDKNRKRSALAEKPAAQIFMIRSEKPYAEVSKAILDTLYSDDLFLLTQVHDIPYCQYRGFEALGQWIQQPITRRR